MRLRLQDFWGSARIWRLTTHYDEQMFKELYELANEWQEVTIKVKDQK
jgi:hypothetical protein